MFLLSASTNNVREATWTRCPHRCPRVSAIITPWSGLEQRVLVIGFVRVAQIQMYTAPGVVMFSDIVLFFSLATPDAQIRIDSSRQGKHR